MAGASDTSRASWVVGSGAVRGGEVGIQGHGCLCHGWDSWVMGAVTICGGGRAAGTSVAGGTGSPALLPLLSDTLWLRVPLQPGGQCASFPDATRLSGAAGSAIKADGPGLQALLPVFPWLCLLYVSHSTHL